MSHINSMTAFGRAVSSNANTTVECELKTLNNRYLELNFKLPDNIKAIEPTLRDMAKKQLSRGKLDVFLRVKTHANTELNLNTELLTALNTALSTVANHTDHSTPANCLDILKWPNMLSDEHDPKSNDLISQTFSKALEDLNQARTREGKALKQLIMQRVDDINTQTKILASHMPALQQKQHQRLLDKLAEANIDNQNERIEQELVILANKSDVAEELDRLQTHCTEINNILNKGGACGRRLDFMMQELNREANTLGSKAVGTEVTNIAVEIKVLIEQMREQIQNIE